MDLKELLEKSGYVPQTAVVETVSWTHLTDDGEEVTDTFTTCVKRHSAGTIERMWSDTGKDPNRSHMATLIADSIMQTKEGEAKLFSYDQAFKLEPSLAEALIEAIDKVNPIKRKSKASTKN